MRNPNRTIVTLCGSTRFPDAYAKAQRDETLKGHIVISVGLFGHLEGLDMTGELKKELDDLHLDKIDLAHEIFVVNPIVHVCTAVGCLKPCKIVHARMYGEISDCCGTPVKDKPYIGESTRREIEYAKATGKAVRYLNPPQE